MMKTRIYFLDNLRTFLIFLVVVLHSGLVYESVLENSWIVCDPEKINSLGIVRMYLDLFVMFCIFFISGYFSRISVKSKTFYDFIEVKIRRLIFPWLIAVLTLIPAYKFIFLYSRGLPQEEWFSYFHFFERAGTDLSFYANNPTQNWLWFLPVLFIFQIVYMALSRIKFFSFNISLRTGIILTFIFGLIYSMIISEAGLKGWYHSAFLHFQRERLLVYFASFLLGTLCNKLNVFKSTNKNIQIYIIANVALTISMGVFTAVALNYFFNIIEPGRNYFFISDFYDRATYYAFGLITMLSFLYILIHAFRFNSNKTNNLLNQISANSYSVYIIHLIVIGILALILAQFPIPVIIKFLLLTTLTFTISNMIIYTYKKSIQKTINMKTIATTMILVIMLGLAFKTNSKEGEVVQESDLQTEVTKPVISLHEAVIKGDLETVIEYIDSGADLNKKESSGGSSPLIIATLLGKTEIAKILIEAGADINIQNNDGSTALHTAAFFCRTDMVRLLLANNADITIRNNSGSTAKESVIVPFEAVKGIYDFLSETLSPLGLQLDYDYLKETRPAIANML